jgi:adenine C2-methylase RlmN of 23S rRNA A2503 and tRNA A37
MHIATVDTVKTRELDFRNQPPQQIETLFREHGFPYQRMLNFRKAFREQDVEDLKNLKGIQNLDPLIPHLPLEHLRMNQVMEDEHGNRKYQFATRDNLLIESVLMPSKRDLSVCISVQAGCRFGCTLCNTGRRGFKRNLLPHEMLEQIRIVYQGAVYPARLGCVSLMGMGEPFDNLDNCRTAFEWIRSCWGATNRYVSIVYCLLREVNDSDEDADALIRLVSDLPSKINLLNYNAVERTPYKPATETRFERFRTRLRAGGISVLHRKSLGTSINAGCGQLGCV